MEEKINIAELLKDCPKGMELDCTMFEEVYFDHVDDLRLNSIKCYVNNGNEHFEITLDEHGQYISNKSAKCVIFPKGKTTWEGFDRHATEEKKQKLFDAIEKNGYKWNAETKTLEKLIEPKFKVGDRIQGYGTHINHPIRVVKSLECDRYRLDNGNYIKFGDEHAYKLLKFDITTLKPFDKVLVRYDNVSKWCATSFSHIDKDLRSHRFMFITTSCSSYPKMIPYEGNEHLRGTTDDCDSYYKTWEE